MCWSGPARARSCWRATKRRRLEPARPVLRELAGVPRDLRRLERARSTRPPRASGTARRSGGAPTSARPGSTRARASPTRPTATEDVEGLEPRRAERPAARRRRGAGHLREPRRRRDLVAALDARGPAGQRGLGRPGEPAARPSRDLGADVRPGRRRPLLGDRPGHRPVRDDRRRRRPGRRATGACAGTGRASTRRSASASTSSSARRSTATACTSRTTSACTAATTPADRGRRSPKGLPTEFGFAAATHPHDRDTFYVIPLDPGHGRTMPDGQAAVWRTQDAGSSWQRARNGLPQQDAFVGVLREGMAIDTYDAPGLYFGTSTGQVFASADEGESWSEIASYLPAISSVEVAILDSMAEVYLPSTLPPLFPGLPRRVDSTRRPSTRRRPADERVARASRPPVRARPGDPPAHPLLRRPGAGDARHAARASLPGRRDRGDQRRLKRDLTLKGDAGPTPCLRGSRKWGTRSAFGYAGSGSPDPWLSLRRGSEIWGSRAGRLEQSA